MLNQIKKYRIQLVFLFIGAIGGFLYWKLVGCRTGTCPIKSVWYYMTLWGAVMGYLVGDLIKGLSVKGKSKNEKTV